MDIAFVQTNGRQLLLSLIPLHLLYQLSIRLYIIAIHIASWFNHKASLWVKGRQDWQKKLSQFREQNTGKLVWIHCASLGEFEQGRSVIESIRKKYPQTKILLTFFSPSGYEIRKNYAEVDFVCYLPADTKTNAKTFISIIQPSMVIFVKYEYWANYFFQLKEQQIPLIIVSGILRDNQRFFGIFSSFWKTVLACVTHFYVQDENTEKLLHGIGIPQVTIAGDTRFDRVSVIPDQKRPEALSKLETFCNDRFVVVAGSTWPQEEEMLSKWKNKEQQQQDALIIIPHEIGEQHIESIISLFPRAVRWSKCETEIPQDAVLILDTIGLLSTVYQFADVVVIGGGFGKGIHNTLEAATWGVPVIFGPKHEKFREALGLKSCGGGFSFRSQDELQEIIEKFKADQAFSLKSGENAKKFVVAHTGATSVIMSGIEKILK
jgi:3-deoxy-D-manno-octulosonic-acid transferase